MKTTFENSSINKRYTYLDKMISEIGPENLTHLQKQQIESYLLHPVYTNYTFDFKNTLDYIYYKKDSKCQLKAILDMPEHSEIQEEAPDGSGLPSNIYGSDHLRIEAIFQIFV